MPTKPDHRGETISNLNNEQLVRETKLASPVKIFAQVIEVSSDEEPSHPSPHAPAALKSRSIRYIHAHKPVSVSSSDSEPETEAVASTNDYPLLHSPVKASHKLEVIDLTLSSSDEDNDGREDDHLDKLLSDSELNPLKQLSLEGTEPKPQPSMINASRPFPSSLSEHQNPWDTNDGSILTWNEPRSAARPIPKPRKPHAEPAKQTQVVSNIASSSTPEAKNVVDTSPPLSEPYGSAAPGQVGRRTISVLPCSSSTNANTLNEISKKPSAVKPTAKAPRMTKKAKQVIEQARREQYAQNLFDELNQRVFKDGLPKETALKWSTRLLTTAGRARWKRSRDGTQTTEIELATKILDCDERIRNTLSHEMCHLACWIIDGDPKEGHGKAFKSWAAKIMRRRSDIEVTTRHNYEISYRYEWECGNCGKIYGRHSKSIKPEECRCGACKVGVLVPLFKVRAQQTPRGTKTNRQVVTSTARDSPQQDIANSPLHLDLLINVQDAALPGQAKTGVVTNGDVLTSTIDVQLAALTKELGGIGILP